MVGTIKIDGLRSGVVDDGNGAIVVGTLTYLLILYLRSADAFYLTFTNL